MKFSIVFDFDEGNASVFKEGVKAEGTEFLQTVIQDLSPLPATGKVSLEVDGEVVASLLLPEPLQCVEEECKVYELDRYRP